MSKFKIRLKELRLENGLTQDNLASTLGYNRVTITDWENRGTEPNYDTLIRLAKLLKTSVDYLIGFED